MDYKSFCMFREDALKLLGSSIKGDLKYVFTESKKLSSDKDKLPQFLDLVADLLRDAVAIKGIGTDDNVINKDVSDKIKEFSSGLQIQNILNMIDKVQQTKSLLDRNANHQLAVEVMMLNIAGGYR